MHFDALTADELSSVLHCLSAKQLTAVKATSRELRMAARRALNAPRFTERKRWAALGVGLIRVGEQGCSDASVRTALDEFEAKYWRRSERPLDFGFGLTFIETDASAWASVSAVGGDYIKAVAPSRCVVRMTGPMEVDCQHVVHPAAPPPCRGTPWSPRHSGRGTYGVQDTAAFVNKFRVLDSRRGSAFLCLRRHSH